MSNANYQLITSQRIKDEVALIKQEYLTLPNTNPLEDDDFDLCLRIDYPPGGDVFLTGFYEIRINGNYKRNLFKESNAISNTTGNLQNVPLVLKSLLYLKHDDFIFLLGNPDNLILQPKILASNPPNFPSYLKALIYKMTPVPAVFNLDDIYAIDQLLAGGGNLFPSPPATGTNQ